MSGLFNPTVAWITTRATLGRRRALLFAIPAVVLILVTVALKASHPPSRPWPSHVLGTFGFSVLLPLTALIIGSSVLGAEIDDGEKERRQRIDAEMRAEPWNAERQDHGLGRRRAEQMLQRSKQRDQRDCCAQTIDQ